MLWEVDIYAAEGQPDLGAREAAAAAAELHLLSDISCDGGAGPASTAGTAATQALAVTSARGFLIQGELDRGQIERIADELLADRVVERPVVAPVGDAALARLPAGRAHWIHVLPKPGVMDPVAQSAMEAIADLGIRAEAVRTLKKYAVGPLPDDRLAMLCSKVLANDAIEQVILGPLDLTRLEVGSAAGFQLVTVPIRAMSDGELAGLSRQGQLFLSLVEMRAIQDHFGSLGRDPTDVELETVAQTWSEHCSHKTLAGRIRYRDENGERTFENMLKETIFAATQEIRRQAGDGDWCVSVFSDNAGVIRFDDQYNVVFKVETHNHPSALEPYGGANTGIGGVIRDPMGTGMGAKPICNTDVFCFAPPDTPVEDLPPGVLHPRRVMKGVVAGVRDYGNRMGIPTVNGAIYFDPRYLGNPLVYCGNIGLIPRDQSFKRPRAGDLIVAVGGRTGRDGIHGDTFSSAELTSHSETVSGGAVQIGNAITEKMVLDVLLAARDRGLYNAVTDCGAGGFSSAVGEMGEKIGAEVWLDRAPLKYEGLTYTEIWISEAQERMVLSVPEEKWQELESLCGSEGVEATVIGQFAPTGRLVLKYGEHQVADLAMDFLHDGRPPVVREAVWDAKDECRRMKDECQAKEHKFDPSIHHSSFNIHQSLLKILSSLNVCSKEWVIRQYDHEVQGGSVLKPLVGAANDGPSDAAVLRPVLHSRRGIVIACGMNPRYGDFDTYWMAASAIDEAVRNCVAVGADPARIAILDNFCWGATDRPETLGSLVRAALACHDVAVALGTPFISGKDSLNNEFRPSGKGVGSLLCEAPEGPYRQKTPDPFSAEPISIPPSLLISAIGQVDDVARCVSMDLKEAGNLLYLVGMTHNELGGSQFALVEGLDCREVPKVDAPSAKRTFAAMHRAIHAGLVRACHDLSEGGLAVAAAEMAFAGGLGARIDLSAVPYLPSPAGGTEAGEKGDSTRPQSPARQAGPTQTPNVVARLFSESNTRFLCEVRPRDAAAFERTLRGIPHARIGEVVDDGKLRISVTGAALPLVEADLESLKEAWQQPLRW
jgi:phosphoribosylformylglycinamidine synthase